ncbi:hypothetical protein QNO00_06460 [Arthrobacter sp. zg-Y1219]|uniref:hypothetical protein n=1 Tax=Arthrobacter sp. zg-Y1219 TaxID=3049067 RepID=UPI0024C237CA|nr:hypothetical protein [Arthrobacter sp. zg-Y1219]MDK1359908.1 hypothetical protein [Arthrobacter sp. zg-Y1219]
MEIRDNRDNTTPEKATRRWFDDFMVELRLLDVPGDAIGDAVASAQEFLTDAGGTPAEVFGDPRSYAESLDLPRRRMSRSAWAALMVPTCLGLLGFFAVAAAVSSAEASVHVTVPGFLIVLTALLLLACAPLYMGFLLRGPLWRAGLAGAAVFGLQVAILLLAGDVVLFVLPAAPTALVGGAVLLATSLWGQFSKQSADDPVVEPVSGRPRSSFGHTLLGVLGNWLLFLNAAAVSAWFLLR